MDFSAILTTLWNKIGKPLPNILVGLVFIFLAPEQIRWVGYIFLAIGVSSFLEWLAVSVFPKLMKWSERQDLYNKINSLTDEEFWLLNECRINQGISLNTERMSPKDKKTQEALFKFEGMKLVESETWGGYGGSGYSFYLLGDVIDAIKDIIEKTGYKESGDN